MGTGRFAGGFEGVSEPDPIVILEGIGIKGPCLGSDKNVLLEVSAWVGGFVWDFKVKKNTPQRAHGIPDLGLCAVWEQGRAICWVELPEAASMAYYQPGGSY